jgi:ribosome-associated heat shock protein Hsp15
MDEPASVRLDKWLWAARFYKTRTVAKTAIEAGHVRVNGERAKVAREVRPGLMISLRQGREDREVEVLALSDQRRGAPEAQRLYRETEASLDRRERARLARQAEHAATPDGRPGKKDRRLIAKLKRAFLSEL